MKNDDGEAVGAAPNGNTSGNPTGNPGGNFTGDRSDRRAVAERLFEAFRAVGPFKRKPGFGHASRPGEFQLIHRLAREPGETGMRVGDLAAWLGIKPPSVTQLVDALASRGLVERFADGDDRRAIRVRLSRAGLELAASFHERAIAETEAIVEHLGAEDASRLAELLGRTAEFLSVRHGPGCHPGCAHHRHQGDD